MQVRTVLCPRGWDAFVLGGAVKSTAFQLAAAFAAFGLVGVGQAQTLYVSVNSGGTIQKVNSTSITTFASGLTHPTGIAFGGDGNLYVSQDISGTGTSVVSRVTVPGASVTSPITGLQLPMGVAVNSSGDLFIADYSSPMTIYKVPSGSSTAASFATGLNSPFGLAFNASGTLFVANRDNNTVVQVDSFGAVSAFASGFNQPNDLAVDGSGNIFVSNFGNGTISKVTPGGSVSQFVSGLTSPLGIEYDPVTGALYVADQGAGSIYKITNLSGATGSVSTFANGLGGVQYLAIAAVPEPASYAALAGAALLSLAAWRRRRSKASSAA